MWIEIKTDAQPAFNGSFIFWTIVLPNTMRICVCVRMRWICCFFPFHAMKRNSTFIVQWISVARFIVINSFLCLGFIFCSLVSVLVFMGDCSGRFIYLFIHKLQFFFWNFSMKKKRNNQKKWRGKEKKVESRFLSHLQRFLYEINDNTQFDLF